MDGSSHLEFSEFQKFLRHFCTRLVQALVQARMHQMNPYPCKANPDTPDWFNMTIDEIGEVAAYMKSNLKRYPPCCPSMSVDFFLHTAEGDQLPLESWTIAIEKDKVDENVNVHTTLYHQMGTLLKSVMMAARLTPSYRYYVKKQSPETFVIFYRIYEGSSNLMLLGEGRRSKKIGLLLTPFGSIHVDLHYRMKMELNSSQGPVEDVAATQKLNSGPLRPSGSNRADEQISMVPHKECEMMVASSPVSGDVNFFSSVINPEELQKLSQNESGKFKIDQSSVATSPGSPSPRASSSFPQRSVLHLKQARVRNNSFPFASLLIASQTSFEQQVGKSQLLPKVPEDSTIPPSDAADVTIQRNQDLEQGFTKTRSAISLPGHLMVGGVKDEERKAGVAMSRQKPVLFACSPSDMEGQSPTLEGHPPVIEAQGASDFPENEKMATSDDSFVKIIAFASSSEDLGWDISSFVKEIRLAPFEIRSFAEGETASALSTELDQLKGRACEIDSFVENLRESNDER